MAIIFIFDQYYNILVKALCSLELKKMKPTFLYYLKTTLYFTGILPDAMLKSDKTWYTLYKHISHVFYLLLLSFLYLEVPYIWNNNDEFIEGLNVIITFTVLTFKMHICRGEKFSKLICEMVAMEESITAHGDIQILDIYKKYINRGRYLQLYNIFVNILGGVSFISPYAINYVIMDQVDGEERRFPFFMWMPFNKNNHYFSVFMVNVYFLTMTAVHYFTAPVLIIILLLYVSFRLRVLAHLLRNIRTYTNKYRIDEKDVSNEDVIKFCILEHLKIIRITKTLNACVKGVTMLEFILLSAQIALILFQGFTTQALNVIIASIVHVSLLLVQMLLFYWHADEIRHESVAISDALYETDWYEYKCSLRATLQIMMVRAQSPLHLSVGPFGAMSLPTALKILKGVYTYVTFLQHSYGRKSSTLTN